MFLSRPEPVTITVCDAVHLNPVTKRKTLVGVYPHVIAYAFPHVMPPVWLYLPFTKAQGIVELSVRVLDGQTVLFETGGKATLGDPNSNYELTAPVSGLVFREPGVDVVEALADGVVFARRELLVIAKELASVPAAALVPSVS
jgi:hypothetical protein